MITYSLCSLHFPIQERYIPFFFNLILLYGFLFRLWSFISIKIQIVYVRVATYYTEEKIDILHHLWYTFSKLMV